MFLYLNSQNILSCWSFCLESASLFSPGFSFRTQLRCHLRQTLSTCIIPTSHSPLLYPLPQGRAHAWFTSNASNSPIQGKVWISSMCLLTGGCSEKMGLYERHQKRHKIGGRYSSQNRAFKSRTVTPGVMPGFIPGIRRMGAVSSRDHQVAALPYE